MTLLIDLTEELAADQASDQELMHFFCVRCHDYPPIGATELFTALCGFTDIGQHDPDVPAPECTDCLTYKACPRCGLVWA